MKTTRRVTGVLLVGFCLLFSSSTVAARRLPNLIFILADDFGYGDLGCYGQKLIQTPRLDQMAREGMRFRQFYAGSTVCAPSRSVLMTGATPGSYPRQGERPRSASSGASRFGCHSSGAPQEGRLPDRSLRQMGSGRGPARSPHRPPAESRIRLFLRLLEPAPRSQLLSRVSVAQPEQGAAKEYRRRGGI